MKLKQQIKTALHLVCILFFCVPIMQAQKAVDQMFTKSTVKTVSLNDESLRTKSTQLNLPIDLGEYGVYQLSLEQTNLFSDDYVTRKMEEDNGNSQLPSTFKGTIQGQPNTLVSLTTNEDYLSGFIDTGEDVIFFEPHKNFNPNAPKNELIIYNQKDVIDQGHACAANHTEAQAENALPPDNQLKSSLVGCYEVEMVLVADFGMFLKYGSNINTLNHITTVLNNVQTNYDDEFDDPITFILTRLEVILC